MYISYSPSDAPSGGLEALPFQQYRPSRKSPLVFWVGTRAAHFQVLVRREDLQASFSCGREECCRLCFFLIVQR